MMLFHSTQIHLGIKSDKWHWNEIVPYIKIKSKFIFIEGLRLTLDNSYFTFNKNLYKQVYGLPMGGTMSDILGIVIYAILQNAIKDITIEPYL